MEHWKASGARHSLSASTLSFANVCAPFPRHARPSPWQWRTVRMQRSESSKRPERKWTCMSNCGACCFIGDYDFSVLKSMLKKPQDVEMYLSMIGPDGWCKHFNKELRNCNIYQNRPRFCRVQLDVFSELYGVESEEELNDFAIACCEEYIRESFPNLTADSLESPEMLRYQALTRQDSDASSDSVS